MKHGQVIFLNGGSSVGKTSIAKVLQRQFRQPFLLMGIDVFWFSMPQRQINLDTVDPQFYTWDKEERDGTFHLRIIPGPILDDIMLARYSAMRAYLDRGLNLIADEVIWKRSWLEESVRVLEPYKVYYVGVFCDDEVLTHREILRGDRMHGWARGSQIYSHLDAEYDITVDTTEISPEQAAEKVRLAIEGGLEPNALQRMRKKFSAVD